VEGEYFIAMELVRGVPLAKLMKQAAAAKRRAPIGVVVSLLEELCEALHYASRGRSVSGQPLAIVHRDLTPSNLIVTDEGHVKIIDFGVAKALSGKFITNTGMAKGKLGYMSVESLSGSASLDARADIFSLGVLAWELVANRRLFRGVNEHEVITKIRSGVVSPPSAHNAACPPALDDVVLRALARDREARWPGAAEMRAALGDLRRELREGPAGVIAWKQALFPTAAAPPPRPATEDEDTLHREPARASESVILAEGSELRPSATDIEIRIPSRRSERTVNLRASTDEDDPTHVDPFAPATDD
jgi:serine/threonine protein kinase